MKAQGRQVVYVSSLMSCVRRAVHCVVCLVISVVVFAEQTEVSIKALDPHGKVLSGIRFTFGGIESFPTNSTGVTDLQVPPVEGGHSIRVDLPTSLTDEWVLVDSMVHAPASSAEGPAEVVLMRRSDLRLLASEARDAAGQTSRAGEPVSEELRRRILIDHAAEYGLSEEELAAAIAAFGRTEDAMDRGIAAYLAGEYARAEVSLQEAAESQESDFLETLRYLGATQYAQGDYSSAVGTFRKAVGLRPSDLALLSWLGMCLQELAQWHESEEIKRRQLELSIDRHGEDDSRTVIAINNLAHLLQATNRLSEAEPLMRRALAIDEAGYGEDHPSVAIRLNNLAHLLQATNRLSEAEPLMRRALAIDEASYGEDHPDVAIDLNNLATLLQATNRLSEAEPLMRRALAIDEASYGEDHPRVATHLSNLATLLQATNRLGEAEPLMRLALAIDKASYGEDHPSVARDLNNLAQLLQATNRLSEAEALMRRAQAIFESSLGHDHPNTRIVRGNLAALVLKIEAAGVGD